MSPTHNTPNTKQDNTTNIENTDTQTQITESTNNEYTDLQKHVQMADEILELDAKGNAKEPEHTEITHAIESQEVMDNNDSDVYVYKIENAVQEATLHNPQAHDAQENKVDVSTTENQDILKDMQAPQELLLDNTMNTQEIVQNSSMDKSSIDKPSIDKLSREKHADIIEEGNAPPEITESSETKIPTNTAQAPYKQKKAQSRKKIESPFLHDRDSNDLDLNKKDKKAKKNKKIKQSTYSLNYILYSKRLFMSIALLACFVGLYAGYLAFGSTSFEVLWRLAQTKNNLQAEVEEQRIQNAALQRKVLELKALEPK